MKKALVVILIFSMYFVPPIHSRPERGAGEKEVMSLERYVREVCRKDQMFQQILVSGLYLKYNKTLNLPQGDIVLSLAGQYNFKVTDAGTSGPQGSIALSKLFPETGTEVYAGYSVSPARTSTKNATSFQAYISQPIARNAFGYETRTKSKIIGVENAVSSHQIVEAYEDYLASLTALYYQWYSDFENLRTAQTSLKKSRRLLKNIRSRYRNRIAHRKDVDRMELQVMEKQETLLDVETQYAVTRDLVYAAMRYNEKGPLVPEYRPFRKKAVPDDFDREYAAFSSRGRTGRILSLMERKANLEVKLNARALLPSANLLLGYSDERTPMLEREIVRKYGFAGFKLDFPLQRSVEKAREITARISAKETALSIKVKSVSIKSDLKKLYRRMKQQKELVAIYENKVKTAKRIVASERKMYLQARSTLKDLVDSIDALDEYSYKLVYHRVNLSVLTVEWLRMTDRLVTRKFIREKR